MKALSLTQPWATLVVIRAKKIETRGWRVTPSYIGPLYIHAAKNFPRQCRELCYIEPFKSALNKAGIWFPNELPLGALLGKVQVTGYMRSQEGWRPPEPELSFGDYSDGRLLIELSGAESLPNPIPFKGQLGYFWVPDIQPEAK